MAVIYDNLPYLLCALIELMAKMYSQNVWEQCIISMNIVQQVGSEICVYPLYYYPPIWSYIGDLYKNYLHITAFFRCSENRFQHKFLFPI